MSDGMHVPYPKGVREKAKDRDGMFCLDINPHHGVRITLKGPAHEDDLRYLAGVYRRLLDRRAKREDADDE